jgi:glycogen phosphorylase
MTTFDNALQKSDNSHAADLWRKLQELAHDLWFSWNEDAIELFCRIDPKLWEASGRNPVMLLKRLDRETIETLAGNQDFLKQLGEVLERRELYETSAGWFDEQYPEARKGGIAYFCAEFGIHESLPIYSGGLGVLAGDHCKSASDLGVPLIGVGLLYQKGYFHQRLAPNGEQEAQAEAYDFAQLPVTPVRLGGREVVVSVALPEMLVRLKVWSVKVGRVTIFLLDANHELNDTKAKELTSSLYGGGHDTRIMQEILLGIGGVRALRAMNIHPGVYHINEGHAAFLSFERLRELLYAGVSFDAALEYVRAGTVFTTHTPVPAGHDAFSLPMLEYYLEPTLRELPGYRDEFIRLGLDLEKNVFNMTYLGLNCSSFRNGVSKLHGKVSRRMFQGFHGNIPAREVPIHSITNGVHLSSWLAPELRELYDRYLPFGWGGRLYDEEPWRAVEHIPDEELWQIHQRLKDKLIRAARRNVRMRLMRNGEPAERADAACGFLSSNALTIGFARRFATYKRATLIFSDLDRLNRLINHPERPVQILFAGKAHPADRPGQEMIREIERIAQLEPFRGKIVMLEDYDIQLGRLLVQGVDVWLNNPRRPYEASGTSGQKAALNGILNFSVLDGWWEEGYDGRNGWSIGGTDEWEGIDPAQQDRENTECFYRVMEQEIVPMYYDRNENEALSTRWLERMKYSIRTLAPRFNSDRMVRDYVEQAYIPAIRRSSVFAAEGYHKAAQVADFKRFIRESWHHVRIASVQENAPVDGWKNVAVIVYFGPIWNEDTTVEIVYYENRGDVWEPVILPMRAEHIREDKTAVYRARVPGHLAHGPHFSVRVRPISADFAHSFELPYITSTLQ